MSMSKRMTHLGDGITKHAPLKEQRGSRIIQGKKVAGTTFSTEVAMA